MPKNERGKMEARRGQEASSPDNRATLPKILVQDLTLLEVLPEAASRVTSQQYALLLQQVQSLATAVQSLQ